MPMALLATLIAFFGIPRVSAALAAVTGDSRLVPAMAFERYAAAEPSFKLMSTVLVDWPGYDADYYRYLQLNGPQNVSATAPDVSLAQGLARSDGPKPDIFVIVVDSLRRDYLSPYNPAVTFTPNIARFADESFAFANAFTRHGGTQLAMPSIWIGGFVARGLGPAGFVRANSLEKLLDTDGYHIVINDYTVRDLLQAKTTVIDPKVPSVDTDLCQNLQGLEEYLDASGGHGGSGTPTFGYFAPMNVHILNTRRPGQESSAADAYPGFYGAYASRLQRIDACFGNFIGYLKAHGRYDHAIIVLTSDHGDSLGEDGHWGHGYSLFPEDIRIPLIVHLPPDLAKGVTTDLARLTFSTDIAPTLYSLLGHPVEEHGRMWGTPLFVSPDGAPSPRRRESYLVTSSYGPTFALLRRNGRWLYVSDLFERKEFAYDLHRGPIGEHMLVDHELRRLNQRQIREQVAESARVYRTVLK
jgi:Sulfatase